MIENIHTQNKDIALHLFLCSVIITTARHLAHVHSTFALCCDLTQ